MTNLLLYQRIAQQLAEDIRRADHDRLLDKLRAPVEADEADHTLAEEGAPF